MTQREIADNGHYVKLTERVAPAGIHQAPQLLKETSLVRLTPAVRPGALWYCQ